MTAAESPTALLLRAADRLDEMVAAAPEGPWKPGGIGDYGWTVHMGDPASRSFESLDTRMDSDQGLALARYIAAVDPRVGADLADVLRAAAGMARGVPEMDGIGIVSYAMAAARKILGEEG